VPISGSILKRLRKNAKMTQVQMAEFLGITEQHYQLYEYGKANPTVDRLEKLADLFGVSTDYILGRLAI